MQTKLKSQGQSCSQNEAIPGASAHLRNTSARRYNHPNTTSNNQPHHVRHRLARSPIQVSFVPVISVVCVGILVGALGILSALAPAQTSPQSQVAHSEAMRESLASAFAELSGVSKIDVHSTQAYTESSASEQPTTDALFDVWQAFDTPSASGRTIVVIPRFGLTADEINDAINEAWGTSVRYITDEDLSSPALVIPFPAHMDAAWAISSLKETDMFDAVDENTTCSSGTAQKSAEDSFHAQTTQSNSVDEADTPNNTSTTAEDTPSKPDTPSTTQTNPNDSHASQNTDRSIDSNHAPIHTNDPDLNLQWGLTAEVGVDALRAWQLAKTDNTVGVIVLDSGANVNHPDLKPNVVDTFNATCDPHANQQTLYDVTDEVGHGTEVAGIIAARANNAMGIAGVSYNANLLIAKVARPNEAAQIGWILRALDRYVVRTGPDTYERSDIAKRYNARVINLSAGGMGDVLSRQNDVLIQALHGAHAAGFTIVTAAGNESPSFGQYAPYPTYPGDDAVCINVINVERQNSRGGITLSRRADSNYNEPGKRTKQISAPGTSIYTTSAQGGYTYATGTSMAAPFVSGVAALMYAVNPGLSPDGVASHILNTARDINKPGWDDETGAGVIDAYAAVWDVS